jgi:hypothetical protein
MIYFKSVLHSNLQAGSTLALDEKVPTAPGMGFAFAKSREMI